jgi:hypothetical protein
MTKSIIKIIIIIMTTTKTRNLHEHWVNSNKTVKETILPESAKQQPLSKQKSDFLVRCTYGSTICYFLLSLYKCKSRQAY